MMKKMKIWLNESLLDIVDEQTIYERRALKEDIQINGQNVPIEVLPNGMVLDGRNRFEICEELGIKPKYKIIDIPPNDVEAYMIRVNLLRRHMNDFQKIEHSWKLHKLETTPSPEPPSKCKYCNGTELIRLGIRRWKSGNVQRWQCKKCNRSFGQNTLKYDHATFLKNRGRMTDNIGRSINVGRNTIQRAIWLINNASDSIIRKLRIGEISITDTYIKLRLSEGGMAIKSRSKHYVTKDTKFQCPKCFSIHTRDQILFVRK